MSLSFASTVALRLRARLEFTQLISPLPIFSNLRQSCEWRAVTNALAYYILVLITSVKGFAAQAFEKPQETEERIYGND